nr:AMP-binding protein [Actinomycetota bacterium]
MALLDPGRTTAGVPLASGLAGHGTRIALATDERSLTYLELDELVSEARARLGPMRRLVLVAATNEVEAIVWYLAALAGAHPVLLADGGDLRHVAGLVARYDPDVVVAPADGRWSTEERRSGTSHQLHPDLALLLTTSGSTGSPRLVRLSAGNVQANATSIVGALGVRPTDRAATTLPPHYSYGLSVVNSHLLVGAALLLTEHSVVDRCFWERMRRDGMTTFAGVPHTFELLDRAGFPTTSSVPSLRYVTQAGGRMAPEDVTRCATGGQREGWDLFVMYGQTEATARMAVLPAELALEHPGSVGVPVPGGSFRLAPVEDARDGVGELVFEGPNVMLGYAEGPADLAEGATTAELRTGDLARRTPEGLYEVVGRRSRFVKLFGLRIDLDQVELVLRGAGV